MSLFLIVLVAVLVALNFGAILRVLGALVLLAAILLVMH
jgi:hypothetical protein